MPPRRTTRRVGATPSRRLHQEPEFESILDLVDGPVLPSVPVQASWNYGAATTTALPQRMQMRPNIGIDQMAEAIDARLEVSRKRAVATKKKQNAQMRPPKREPTPDQTQLQQSLHYAVEQHSDQTPSPPVQRTISTDSSPEIQPPLQRQLSNSPVYPSPLQRMEPPRQRMEPALQHMESPLRNGSGGSSPYRHSSVDNASVISWSLERDINDDNLQRTRPSKHGQNITAPPRRISGLANVPEEDEEEEEVQFRVVEDMKFENAPTSSVPNPRVPGSRIPSPVVPSPVAPSPDVPKLSLLRRLSASLSPQLSALVSPQERETQDRASQDRASQARTSQDRAFQDRASQDRASQARTSQDRAFQDRASQDRASQDRASQARTSQDRASQDRASQARAPQDRAPRGPALQTRVEEPSAPRRKSCMQMFEGAMDGPYQNLIRAGFFLLLILSFIFVPLVAAKTRDYLYYGNLDWDSPSNTSMAKSEIFYNLRNQISKMDGQIQSLSNEVSSVRAEHALHDSTPTDVSLQRRSAQSVNFLSVSLGAMIDPKNTSPTLGPRRSLSNRGALWFFSLLAKNVVRSSQSPLSAITKWEEIGDCWCSAPRNGTTQLAVLLGRDIVAEGMVVEHIPLGASLEPEAAPKTIEVWARFKVNPHKTPVKAKPTPGATPRRIGFSKIFGGSAVSDTPPPATDALSSREAGLGGFIIPGIGTLHGLLMDLLRRSNPFEPPSAYSDDPVLGPNFYRIGKFDYNIHSPDYVQAFKLNTVVDISTIRVDKVVFRVTSNWGANHTCIYRFRLHGHV